MLLFDTKRFLKYQIYQVVVEKKWYEHISLLYSFSSKYPEHYSMENNERTLKPGEKQVDWSRTSELEGQPCGQPPGFSVYLPCTLDWVQGGLQPQNTNKRSLFPLTKGPEKGKLNRDLVGISSPSPITWHRWAV